MKIDMCKSYDPLVANRCSVGRKGTLKCHSKRPDCPDYKPSESKEIKNDNTK